MLNVLRIRIHKYVCDLKSKVFPEKPKFVNPYSGSTAFQGQQREIGVLSAVPQKKGSDSPAVRKERHWFLKNCDDVIKEDLQSVFNLTSEHRKKRESEKERAEAYREFVELATGNRKNQE